MRNKIYISVVTIFIAYFIYYNYEYSKSKKMFNKLNIEYISNRVENSKLIDYYSKVLQKKSNYESNVREIKDIVKNINSINVVKEEFIDKDFFIIKRDEDYIENIDLKKEKYTLTKKIYLLEFNIFMQKLTNVFKSGYFIDNFSIEKNYDKKKKSDYYNIKVELYKWKV